MFIKYSLSLPINHHLLPKILLLSEVEVLPKTYYPLPITQNLLPITYYPLPKQKCLFP
ncbi:MAG: hypothetical protein ACRC2M_12010 [Planktothrix sp.]